MIRNYRGDVLWRLIGRQEGACAYGRGALCRAYVSSGCLSIVRAYDGEANSEHSQSSLDLVHASPFALAALVVPSSGKVHTFPGSSAVGPSEQGTRMCPRVSLAVRAQ